MDTHNPDIEKEEVEKVDCFFRANGDCCCRFAQIYGDYCCLSSSFSLEVSSCEDLVFLTDYCGYGIYTTSDNLFNDRCFVPSFSKWFDSFHSTLRYIDSYLDF